MECLAQWLGLSNSSSILSQKGPFLDRVPGGQYMSHSEFESISSKLSLFFMCVFSIVIPVAKAIKENTFSSTILSINELKNLKTLSMSKKL